MLLKPFKPVSYKIRTKQHVHFTDKQYITSVQCSDGHFTMYRWIMYNVQMDNVQCTDGHCTMYRWTLYNVQMDNVQCTDGHCTMYRWTMYYVQMDIVQ